MRTNRNNFKAVAAAAVVTGATLFAGSALTASNTVPDGQAGDGSGTVTGYTVSNITYDLNAADPTKLDSVSFDLDSVPDADSEVRVNVDQSSSTWFTCAIGATVNVTCDTSGLSAPNVADADQLRVVAVD